MGECYAAGGHCITRELAPALLCLCIASEKPAREPKHGKSWRNNMWGAPCELKKPHRHRGSSQGFISEQRDPALCEGFCFWPFAVIDAGCRDVTPASSCFFPRPRDESHFSLVGAVLG